MSILSNAEKILDKTFSVLEIDPYLKSPETKQRLSALYSDAIISAAEELLATTAQCDDVDDVDDTEVVIAKAGPIRGLPLRLFCDTDSTHPCSEPFNEGHFTYVTDNVIALRVPRDEHTDDREGIDIAGDGHPPMKKLNWGSIKEVERWEVWPKHHGRCIICFDDAIDLEPIYIGGRKIDGKYWRKLSILPDLEYGVDDGDQRDTLLLRFAGGEGVIKGMNFKSMLLDSTPKKVESSDQ